MAEIETGETPSKKTKVAKNDEMIEVFENWMKNEGIKISEKTRIGKEGSCSRYGMVATADINEGEMLFTIPKKVLLWTDTCSVADVLKECEELASESGWCRLITCLMYEYKKPDSNWLPYLRFLPEKKYLNHPMFWSTEERNSLLKGTGCGSEVDRDLERMEEEYKSIVLPFIRSNTKLGFDEAIHSFDLYKHMVALVMAYSFTDENGDECPKMVPLADVLNHVADNNAQLEFGLDELQMIAVRDIKAGEEIYNTYGALDNCRLLERYGFIEKDSMFDGVEIPCTLLVDVARQHEDSFDNLDLKIKLLEERGLLDGDVYLNERSVLNSDEFYLIVNHLRLSAEQLDKVKCPDMDEDALRDHLQLAFPLTPDVTEDDAVGFDELRKCFRDDPRVVAFLRDVTQRKLAGYSDVTGAAEGGVRAELSAGLVAAHKRMLNAFLQIFQQG